MRLPSDVFRAAIGVAFAALLSSCASGGYDDMAVADASAPPADMARYGPAADYPVVIGDPFTVDGVTYTPSDDLDYDEVGYAAIDSSAEGVTAESKTLPLPSYVEVTSLQSGKTVLVRVERRGPMDSQRLLGLSPAAQAQLGVREGTAIRVRRVNPPEYERAELRRGQPGATRLDTPDTLLAVLREKLPARGAASLLDNRTRVATDDPATPPAKSRFDAAFGQPETRAAASVPVTQTPVQASAVTSVPRGNANYPLPPLIAQPLGARMSATQGAPRVARQQTARPAPPVQARPAPRAQVVQQQSDGRFVVQAGAFSSKRSAQHIADRIEGFVQPGNGIYRVRTGPYTTRGQAEAALAKVRAAGYSDARVFTAG